MRQILFAHHYGIAALLNERPPIPTLVPVMSIALDYLPTIEGGIE